MKMPFEHPKLKICVGDILSKSSVEIALAGQDAVCTTIGVSPSLKPMDIFSEGVKNVLAAMKAVPGIKLIAVTGIGAGDSRGHGGFLYDKIFQPLLLKTIYEDKDREEVVLKASSAHWMILRPGMLTNGKFTGKYRVLTDMKDVTVGKISRDDVADFILRQFDQPTYFKQTPSLTY